MGNQVQIDKVIAYMNTVTAITDVLGSRIFFGLPIEEQTSTYLSISIIAESTGEVNKGTLVEFRFIGTKNSTYKSLMDIRKIVSDNILGRQAFDSFNCYGVNDEGLVQGYGENDEKLIIQDYRFYFTT